jgi:hypothetical protein
MYLAAIKCLLQERGDARKCVERCSNHETTGTIILRINLEVELLLETNGIMKLLAKHFIAIFQVSMVG